MILPIKGRFDIGLSLLSMVLSRFFQEVLNNCRESDSGEFVSLSTVGKKEHAC